MALSAFRHLAELVGLPEPPAAPCSWEEFRARGRDAYFGELWSEEPPGWSHCQGWAKGPFAGHALPLLLDRDDGVGAEVAAEIERRVGRVVERVVREQGASQLWSGAGCHIVLGEVPFRAGHLAEALRGLRDHARALLASRSDGLWRWQPASERHRSLGRAGDHTLGQAAQMSFVCLRAARLSGDRALAAEALAAMRQMELYAVPRGAQTWECPLYQPDILAAAYAVRACCEAYRLNGDPAQLEAARAWALTGLPFVYLWELPDRDTMLYNVIAVIGSTFHTHSWIGLPVVWCGLVYAYALQELAEHDRSFDWLRVAQGITRSAARQQYREGKSRGCYPDSWDLVRDRPNPADINPENLLLNEFRLRGRSPEIRSHRFLSAGGAVMLNSPADLAEASSEGGRFAFTLRPQPATAIFSSLAPLPRPRRLRCEGLELPEARDEAALAALPQGWRYDEELQALILKTRGIEARRIALE